MATINMFHVPLFITMEAWSGIISVFDFVDVAITCFQIFSAK